VFVKGARYDKMMEAFGGVGVNATSPDELRQRAVNAAIDSGKPTLINAVIDPASRLRDPAASAISIRKASLKKK
jgi:oxalyl-CoA decarboxylase